MGNPDVEKCHHETPCSKAEDVEDVCCEKSEGCCTEQKCFHPEDCTSDICQKKRKKAGGAGCCEDEAECVEDESCCQKVKEEVECCNTEACCEEGDCEDQDHVTRQLEDKIAAL